MKHWTVLLEDLVKDACTKELPLIATSNPDLMNSIEELSHYKNPSKELVESVRDELLPTLEPCLKKTIEAKNFVFPLRNDQKTAIGIALSSFAGLAQPFVGFEGAIIALTAGTGSACLIHRLLNRTPLSCFPEKTAIYLNAVKQLPFPCWNDAIQLALQTYHKSVEKTKLLTNKSMNNVFSSILETEQTRLVYLISETAGLYTPTQQGTLIKETLGQELCSSFAKTIDETVYADISKKTRNAMNFASAAICGVVLAHTKNILSSILALGTALSVLYCAHSITYSHNRTTLEKEILNRCFTQLKPESYLNAFKHSLSTYRTILEKQGSQEQIAMLLD